MSSDNAIIWKLAFGSVAEAKNALKMNRVGKVEVDHQWIAMTIHNDSFFAFQPNCPHQNYSLLGGECSSQKVECPLHKFKFDLKSGSGHGLNLHIYPIKIENDKVFIGFKKNFWN